MKTNKMFLVVGASALALSVVSTALALRISNNKITRAEDPDDFDVTLELTASDLTPGNGTVTLNGNLFTYENFGVSGNVINLSSGSRIYANEDSGSYVGANDFKGAGFDSVTFFGGAGGTATGEINGTSFDISVAESGNFNRVVGNKSFDLSITTGSLALDKITITYGCTYDVEPNTHKVLFVGSGNMGVTSWITSYTEMVNAVDGITAECDYLTTGSFSFCQIGNLETDYAGKAQEFRDKLASQQWDAVYYQLSRRITPSGTDLFDAEYNMFKDVIVPLTKTVTNNITLLALEGTENPEIFDYDETDGQPVATGTNETKTVEEMTNFLEETAIDWASDNGIKVARYGKVFNYCGTVGSNADTRTKAKAYARGLMAYATIRGSEIPSDIATRWVSTVFPSDSSGARTIKNNIGALVNSLTFE